MPDDQTVSHTVTYPEVKDPQKHFPEKNMASPRKAAVLSFNPDGSLCIPADLKDKLANQDLKSTPHKNVGQKGSKDQAVTSTRKRKIFSARQRKNTELWIPPQEGCCHFCYTKDTRRDLGELREIDGTFAHHSCLLFSSGLCQAGNNDEGLWGFLLPHIRKEISRGKRLRCSFCRLPGALVGCHKSRCSYTYHFTCGLNNGCLMQYYENFRSFCASHRPLQYFSKERSMGDSLECPICGDMIIVESKLVPRDILVTECCNMTPLHRHCLQNQADASGYFFRCPMCNNEKKFNSIMKIMGINVPQSDAVWEKEGYYDDLYVEHWRCDVPICLHSTGRSGDSRSGDQWDLMKCATCGHTGAHPACLGFEKKGPKNWKCSNCVTLQKKIDEEAAEAQKKAQEELAKNPPPLPADKQVPDKQMPGPSTQPPTLTNSSQTPTSLRGKWQALSPSKNPFLMTPDVLKEAVYKLCVAKLKQAKLVRKDVDPDAWRGLQDTTDIEEEQAEEQAEEKEEPYLQARVLSIFLTKIAYSPPSAAEPEVDEPADAEEEKDVYNEQKEKLWQIVLKNRENAMLVLAAASTGRGSRAKQTKINCFFKKKDRENYTAQAKRRKIESPENDDNPKQKTKIMPENEFEPFPFQRSPHEYPYPEDCSGQPPLYSKSPSNSQVNKSVPSDTSHDYNENATEIPSENQKTPFKCQASSTPKKSTDRVKEEALSVNPPPVESVSSAQVKPTKKEPAKQELTEEESGMNVGTSYKCYYCPDKFNKLAVRMDHMRTSHPSSVRGWDSSAGKSGKRRRSSKDTEVLGITDVLEISDDNNSAPNDDQSSSVQSKNIKKRKTKKKLLTRRRKTCAKQTCAKQDATSMSEKESLEKKSKDVKQVNEPPKKTRGRPRKIKQGPAVRMCENNLTAHDEEMMKYDELTIEVGKAEPQNDENNVIFQASRDTKKKVEYDWTEDETYALVDYYSVNPPLWDKSVKDETRKNTLLTKLEKKLGIPEDTIASKWMSLVSRYKQERYQKNSSWRFLSQLEFLEELNMTSCPDDVSPLFSLLNTAQSQDHEEVCSHPTANDKSQDIFPDLSDDDVPIQYSDSETESSNSSRNTSLCSKKNMINVSSFEADGDLVTTLNGSNEREKEVKNGELPNVCKDCSKGFPTNTELMQHKLKLRYFCCHCCKNFSTVSLLKEHQLKINSEYSCPFCDDFTSENSKSTIRHIRDVHLKDWVACECLECGTLFKHKDKLVVHLEIGHGVSAQDSDSHIIARDFRCLYD